MTLSKVFHALCAKNWFIMHGCVDTVFLIKVNSQITRTLRRCTLAYITLTNLCNNDPATPAYWICCCLGSNFLQCIHLEPRHMCMLQSRLWIKTLTFVLLEQGLSCLECSADSYYMDRKKPFVKGLDYLSFSLWNLQYGWIVCQINLFSRTRVNSLHSFTYNTYTHCGDPANGRIYSNYCKCT